MKTTAGIIGAGELADLARALEDALRNSPCDDHGDLIALFERETGRIINGLDCLFAADAPGEVAPEAECSRSSPC